LKTNETSIISPKAKIGNNVKIGNFCIIHDNVEIGDDTIIDDYCTLGYPTPLAENKPLIIGKNCLIRSYAIIRRGVVIGDKVIIYPHVVIEDNVIIGESVEIFTGAFIGKEPKGAGVVSRQPKFERRIVIGNECSIGPNVVIFYDVAIGNNTLLGDGASVREQCVIGSYCILSRYVTINYNTNIGNHTKIMDNTHITGNALIGDNVFISTMVGTTNDNIIRMGYGEHIMGPTIEDSVIIGVGASLLPGIKIGKNAIVAAGSVVTKNVAAYDVVMGIPAKVVKNLNVK